MTQSWRERPPGEGRPGVPGGVRGRARGRPGGDTGRGGGPEERQADGWERERESGGSMEPEELSELIVAADLEVSPPAMGCVYRLARNEYCPAFFHDTGMILSVC